jgi:predicted dehydrogenase
MSDPRICIVGAGRFSTRRIYPNIGAAGAKLVGICARTRERSEVNARRFGGRVYIDLDEMLDAEKPDGVMICVNAEFHTKMAAHVMRRGIPVYTEKPPAMTATEALEVARVSKETGVLCMTAFKKRYNLAYTRAREWIEAQDANDLLSLSIDYASGPFSNDSQLRSLLFDFCIHIIDLAGYLFGNAEAAFAYSKGMDAYAVSIKFANGAVGSLSLNDGRSFRIPTEEVEITARGANFMTVHNSSVWRITENGKPVEWREPPTFTSAGDSGNDTGHLAEIVDFLAAIQEGRTTRSNIYESYKSMVLYEAIRESAETGKPVSVQYQTL